MEIKLKSEVPVLLLTGYLGSGKTTLLNRILTNERGIKFAVIVNDIGEVNIDADLIEKGGVVGQKDDSLVALQNGCICCTLKMDLVEQLSDIMRMHRFDYIVIEASGICEPGPIAQTICSMDKIYPPYAGIGTARLDCIVTVVDALRMKDEFAGGLDLLKANIDEEDIENLVIQQIEFCNIVLLNKASEVSESELQRLKDIVRALQPQVEIIPCDYGDVELERILNTQLFDFDKVATSARWISEVEAEYKEDEDDDDEDEHEHHHHGDARFWPKSVIRAKGLCYFAEEYDICYVFEQAGHQVSLRNAGQWYATMPKDELHDMMEREAGLRRDWDEHYGDRMQKLVFIGQHLDKEAISVALDKCLVDK